MVFGGSGPLQPLISVLEINSPVVPLYTSKVPQNAKEVLVEPVVLLIDNVNVLVIVVGDGQALHKPPPERLAPTNVKSPEVHDVPGGG